MGGAAPLLPQYAFMAWCSVKSIGTTLPLPAFCTVTQGRFLLHRSLGYTGQTRTEFPVHIPNCSEIGWTVAWMERRLMCLKLFISYTSWTDCACWSPAFTCDSIVTRNKWVQKQKRDDKNDALVIEILYNVCVCVCFWPRLLMYAI